MKITSVFAFLFLSFIMVSQGVEILESRVNRRVTWVLDKRDCNNLGNPSNVKRYQTTATSLEKCVNSRSNVLFVYFNAKTSLCYTFVQQVDAKDRCPEGDLYYRRRFAHTLNVDGVSLIGSASYQMELLRMSSWKSSIRNYYRNGDLTQYLSRTFNADFYKGTPNYNDLNNQQSTTISSANAFNLRVGPKVSAYFTAKLRFDSKVRQLFTEDQALEYYEKALQIYQKTAKAENWNALTTRTFKTTKYYRGHPVVTTNYAVSSLAQQISSRPQSFIVQLFDYDKGGVDHIAELKIEIIEEKTLVPATVSGVGRGRGPVCKANDVASVAAGALGLVSLAPGINLAFALGVGIFGAFTFLVDIGCGLRVQDDDLSSPLENNLNYCKSVKEQNTTELLDEDQSQRCERLLWNPTKWFLENDETTIADQFLFSNCTTVDERNVTELVQISGIDESKFLEAQTICEERMTLNDVEDMQEDPSDQTAPIIGGVVGGLSIFSLATAFMIHQRKKSLKSEAQASENPLYNHGSV